MVAIDVLIDPPLSQPSPQSEHELFVPLHIVKPSRFDYLSRYIEASIYHNLTRSQLLFYTLPNPKDKCHHAESTKYKLFSWKVLSHLTIPTMQMHRDRIQEWLLLINALCRYKTC